MSPSGTVGRSLAAARTDVAAGTVAQRYDLASSWTDADTAVVCELVMVQNGRNDMLSSFRSASTYLWATGAWNRWDLLTRAVVERLELQDLEALAHRAATHADPDLIGHLVCTAVFLDLAFERDQLGVEILTPLCRIERHFMAGFRARRRAAVRLALDGRPDKVERLLSANLCAARCTSNDHEAAATIGDLGFLLLGSRSIEQGVALIRSGLAERRLSHPDRKTAGMAQQIAALAVLGAEPVDEAITFAVEAGARHVATLLHRYRDRPDEAHTPLLRIW